MKKTLKAEIVIEYDSEELLPEAEEQIEAVYCAVRPNFGTISSGIKLDYVEVNIGTPGTEEFDKVQFNNL